MTSLAALGLDVGTRVRFRRRTGGRWHQGRVTGLETDGSIGLVDDRGRSRAIRLDALEVETKGPRGASAWEPATERAARSEQMALDLFGDHRPRKSRR